LVCTSKRSSLAQAAAIFVLEFNFLEFWFSAAELDFSLPAARLQVCASSIYGLPQTVPAALLVFKVFEEIFVRQY
jgi:hypothetical protein